MQGFRQKIMSGEISQPIHRSFKLAKWKEQYSTTLHKTSQDEKIYKAGIWFHNRLTKIRTEVTKLSFPLKKEKLIRAYIGFINRTYNVVKKETMDLGKDTEVIFGEQIAQAKMAGNMLGKDAAPDAIVTACIDGGRFPLVAALHDNAPPARQGGVTSEEMVINCQKVQVLGQYYSYLEDAWQEIVWNNYVFDEEDKIINIRPEGSIYDKARAVSDYRRQSLIVQGTLIAAQTWQNKLPYELKKTLSRRPVASIDDSSKKRRFIISFDDKVPKLPPSPVIANVIWQEEYLEGVYELDMPLASGVTLAKLVKAWELLGSIASALASKFPDDNSVHAVGTFYKFAPGIKITELESSMMVALDIDIEESRQLLNFFYFDQETKSELWSSPLIKFGDSVYPLISPLLHGNLLRNMEIWMKMGGIDLSERGYLFESQARKEIIEALAVSKVLKNAACAKKSIKLGANKEEIDIVFRIGPKILVGEAKCALYATEPMNYYHFFETLKYASEQALRKSEAVRINLEELIEKVEGFEDLKNQETEVIPFIITNLTLGVGYSIEGVPIHDLITLIKYLDDPKWERMVEFSNDGNKKVGETVTFYSTEEEAANSINEYLQNPPQIEFYKKFLRVDCFPHFLFEKEEKPVISSQILVELPLDNILSRQKDATA